MNSSRDISILLLGNTDRSEFFAARGSLDQQGSVVAAEDVDAAVALLDREEVVPDVIVVAQAYPGQFSTRAIERLRRRAPLARVVGLLGSWCEGEMRTGDPWPAVIRLYWHQWVPRFHQEMERLADGRHSTWALPATASEEERFLVLADERPDPRQGHLLICSARLAMYDWLSAACHRRGFTTTWSRPHELPPAVDAIGAIFDLIDSAEPDFAELAMLSDALGPVPIVALLDFPRAEDFDSALAAGAVAVLSKPLVVEDLYWQLDRLSVAQGSP